MKPEEGRRSSRIQGPEESQYFRLELRELGGSSLRLREQGVSAAPACDRRSSASPDWDGGRSADPGFKQASGAQQLQSWIEGTQWTNAICPSSNRSFVFAFWTVLDAC